MTLQEWLHLFYDQVAATSPIEWIGVTFGIVEVLLARANKIWLYPAGIISVVALSYVLYDAGLYAESLLNIYYLIMSIYGWWYWIKKKDAPLVRITHANRNDWKITLLITIAGTTVLYILLKQYTPSNVPLWDAWVSATAWAGMWLLAKRKVENWLLLNVSNLFAVPLSLYKHLPVYALLMVFYFVVACMGYFKWKKQSV